MYGVEIGLPLPSPANRDEAALTEFGDEVGDARDTQAHIRRQALLSREATVIVPRVREKHRVGQLGSDGEVRVAEQEIGNLRKASGGNRIEGVESNVLLKDLCDGLHSFILPQSAIARTGEGLSTGYTASALV